VYGQALAGFGLQVVDQATPLGFARACRGCITAVFNIISD
jgi:hypothetical protein